VILVVDDDQDLLESFAELVELVFGQRCLIAHGLADLEALGPRLNLCTLAILDVNLGAGQPSGLDCYRWLKRNGYPGRVAFLTGHARAHPLVAQVHQLGDVSVFGKPIGVAEITRMIEGGRP
jgi:FixJ family two-component response regulator